MSAPITLQQQAAHYAAAFAKAKADLPALIAERDAAEAVWVERGGAVRMWCARDAVARQRRHIDRMRKEYETHRLLADLTAGRIR
jgi:hypothetical protein